MSQGPISPIGGTFAPVAPARQHDWNRGTSWDLLGHESVSGFDETHKRCALCPNIKITVRPPQGNPYVDYQLADGTRVQGERQPPCVDTSPQEVKFQ